MYAVDICVKPGDLSREMSEMRTWLDERRFEPSSFSCHDKAFGVLVSVGFRIADQAEAFARRFVDVTDQPSGAYVERDAASKVLEQALQG
jgi:hypothetical protein